MASKNFFRQLGEGMKRYAGGGRHGYWNSLLQMVKDPSTYNTMRGIVNIPHGIGSAVTSLFGHLPENIPLEEELDDRGRRR